jgi:hypothetical protein
MHLDAKLPVPTTARTSKSADPINSLPTGRPQMFTLWLSSAANNACASAISGISGVGAKASRAGPRIACASAAAACRLVELGERVRREQLVAARALLLRDGDGGPERISHDKVRREQGESGPGGRLALR